MKYHGLILTMEMEYLYDENVRHWKKIFKEIREVGKTPILIVENSNIVKIFILASAHYGFNTIPTKFLIQFSIKIWKNPS